MKRNLSHYFFKKNLAHYSFGQMIVSGALALAILGTSVGGAFAAVRLQSANATAPMPSPTPVVTARPTPVPTPTKEIDTSFFGLDWNASTVGPPATPVPDINVTMNAGGSQQTLSVGIYTKKSDANGYTWNEIIIGLPVKITIVCDSLAELEDKDNKTGHQASVKGAISVYDLDTKSGTFQLKDIDPGKYTVTLDCNVKQYVMPEPQTITVEEKVSYEVDDDIEMEEEEGGFEDEQKPEPPKEEEEVKDTVRYVESSVKTDKYPAYWASKDAVWTQNGKTYFYYANGSKSPYQVKSEKKTIAGVEYEYYTSAVLDTTLAVDAAGVVKEPAASSSSASSAVSSAASASSVASSSNSASSTSSSSSAATSAQTLSAQGAANTMQMVHDTAYAGLTPLSLSLGSVSVSQKNGSAVQTGAKSIGTVSTTTLVVSSDAMYAPAADSTYSGLQLATLSATSISSDSTAASGSDSASGDVVNSDASNTLAPPASSDASNTLAPPASSATSSSVTSSVPASAPAAPATSAPTVAPATAAPTAVPTAVPATAVPTAVPTVAPTAAPTASPAPTAAPTPTPSAVVTATPVPTASLAPTQKPSASPSPSASIKPSASPKPSATPTPSATPKPTASPTPSPKPTATPSTAKWPATIALSKDGKPVTESFTLADGSKTTPSAYFKIKATDVEQYIYSGWQIIGGVKYYYDPDTNQPVTGTQIINGTSYLFGATGAYDSKCTGIDVSYWNGTIDWAKVKAAGVEFVIIRAGYRGYGSGVIVQDVNFSKYISGAKAAGLRVGIYFFSQAINAKEGVEEASACINLIKSYGTSYPIYIDTELSGAAGNTGRADNISNADRTAAVVAFCETIKSAGYTPGIYASRSWFTSKLNFAEISGYSLWNAQWGDVNSMGSAGMWQYTATGAVNGIKGNVDMNISYIG